MERMRLELENITNTIPNGWKKNTGGLYLLIKRILDIVISSLLLVILSPFILVIALMVKREGGPAFFLHNRVGQHGRPFKMIKFRTMYWGAENYKFSPEMQKEFEINFKLDNDPRVTPLGNVLRRTSIDELPQLVNVIKGDLSLVGPRPVVEKELEKWRGVKEKLLSVKPGITGNWQVNGRSDTTYEERVSLEMEYVDHQSLKLDAYIFFKTILSVIAHKGAV